MRMDVATRHKQRLLDSGVIESRMQKVMVSQQFETEDGYIVKPLSGSVSMEVPLEWRRSRMGKNEGLFEGATQCLTDSHYMDVDRRSGNSAGCLQSKDQKAMEAELQKFAKDIFKEWNRRQIQSPIDKAIYETFGFPFNWMGETDEVKKSGVKAVVSTEHMKEAKKLLLNLLDKLPEAISKNFEPDVAVDGFLSYSKFSTAASTSDTSALP